MVVIRLSRGGSKHRPHHKVVVAHKQNRRDGNFVEIVGFHNPGAKDGEEKTRIAIDRVNYWVGHGAQMSDTVARLVKEQAAKAAA